MLQQSQSASTTSTTCTCPYCGMPLSRADVACNQRTCRPAALRRVTLVPLEPDGSSSGNN